MKWTVQEAKRLAQQVGINPDVIDDDSLEVYSKKIRKRLRDSGTSIKTIENPIHSRVMAIEKAEEVRDYIKRYSRNMAIEKFGLSLVESAIPLSKERENLRENFKSLLLAYSSYKQAHKTGQSSAKGKWLECNSIADALLYKIQNTPGFDKDVELSRMNEYVSIIASELYVDADYYLSW